MPHRIWPKPQFYIGILGTAKYYWVIEIFDDFRNNLSDESTTQITFTITHILMRLWMKQMVIHIQLKWIPWKTIIPYRDFYIRNLLKKFRKICRWELIEPNYYFIISDGFREYSLQVEYLTSLANFEWYHNWLTTRRKKINY